MNDSCVSHPEELKLCELGQSVESMSKAKDALSSSQKTIATSPSSSANSKGLRCDPLLHIYCSQGSQLKFLHHGGLQCKNPAPRNKGTVTRAGHRRLVPSGG